MRVVESCARCLFDKQKHLSDNEEYLKEIRDINDAIDALNQKEEKVIGCVFGNVYPGFGERIGGSYGYGYGYGAYSRAER